MDSAENPRFLNMQHIALIKNANTILHFLL